MKQISNEESGSKLKVKWKESLNRTASFNKKGSSDSLLNEISIKNSKKQDIFKSSKSKDSIKVFKKIYLNVKSGKLI